MILMGTANKNWLVHFKGNETLALRFDDQIESHLRTMRPILTPFLDETQQQVLKKVAGNRVDLSFYGGYESAERKRCCIGECSNGFDIVQLCAKLTSYDHIRHADCMGALYNCGCKNDHFGDILVDDKHVRVFVCASIAQYVMESCTQIGRSKVTFYEDDAEVERIIQLEMKQVIVPSLRLDSLVGACTHLSRAKAQQLIRAKNVKVDHICLEDCAYLCNNECILSIRGHGRFRYAGVLKTTKNQKIVINLGKYK